MTFTNLPVQLTSFIGRERELAEVERLVSASRLVTLTGAGGCGKTRLAIQVGNNMSGAFADGIWLIDFVPLREPELIPQHVTQAFDLRPVPNQTLNELLLNFVRPKQMLLILDNCEHLVVGIAQVVQQLLPVATELNILATSRQPLAISGEKIYQVQGLAIPELNSATILDLQGLQQYDGVHLFIERARAISPQFRITTENASAIIEICRRLDGIPLALELASARLNILAPQQIAARLDSRFNLLNLGQTIGAVTHHQTLRAAIDWSHDLLNADEQTFLRRLSIFDASFSLDAAEGICREEGMTSDRTLDLLASLVDKSLVIAETTGRAVARYRLLEMIREYARAKLLEAGEFEQAHNQHLDFFLQFAEKAETYMDGPRELEWGIILDAEYDNLRTAFEWAMERDVEKAIRLGGALPLFWVNRGYEGEGRRLISEALEHINELPPENATSERIMLRAKAWRAIGYFANAQGDFLSAWKAFEEAARLYLQTGEKRMLARTLSLIGMGRALSGDTEGAYAAAEEAVALAREVGDKVTLGFALTNMAGVIAVTRHDLDGVRTDGEEGIRLLREAGSRRLTGNMLFGYGVFAAAQGYYDEARSHFTDSLELFAELGDSHPLAMIHSELAHLERRQGHLAQAKSLYRQTLQEWGKIGHRAAMAHDLECFAFIAKAQEEEQRAARLFGAAEILREGAKLPMNHIEQVEYDREVNDLRANMNGSAFTTAWAEGRMMTLEQAVEYALSLPPAPATPLETHDEFGGLTERELEIVSLIGQGKSNGEIATELVLSKRTVEKHVANILSKLELSSRAQIVRWAMVHNLTSKPSL